MMRIKPVNLLLTIGTLAFVLGSGVVAQAGFVAASIDGQGAEASVFLAAGAGGTTSAPVDDQRNPKRKLIGYQFESLAALLGASGSTGGMSSPAPTGSSPAPPAANVAADPSPVPQQRQRLLLMHEPYHPRFIVSRLFRPPRS